MPPTDLTADDEAFILRLIDEIQTEVMDVLDRRVRKLDESGQVRVSRVLALHCLADLTGRLMVAAIASQVDGAQGQRARDMCQAMIHQLQLVITPTARPS